MKPKIFAVLVLSATFFLALAVMDYAVIHGYFWHYTSEWQYPYWMYKYWIALGLVVAVFAVSLAAVVWMAGMRKRFAAAVFATVILFFVGGFLDLFFYMFTVLRGEPYSFDYWSAQYKWFGSWNWSQQIAWTAMCVLGVILAWCWALRKR